MQTENDIFILFINITYFLKIHYYQEDVLEVSHVCFMHDQVISHESNVKKFIHRYITLGTGYIELLL